MKNSYCLQKIKRIQSLKFEFRTLSKLKKYLLNEKQRLKRITSLVKTK